MTGISMGGARLGSAAGAVGASRAAEKTEPAVDAPDDGLLSGISPTARTAALVGVGVAALAGYALYKRPVQSKVIGAIEGVDLLSNPRLPRRVSRSAWGMTSSGSAFGVSPAPKISIEHVDQGALGDCWNIAGLGAIAHRRPQVFEALVREVGDHVIVALPERPVAVTKELPLNKGGGPLFGGSDTDDPVFWPAYVEKAQAAVARNGYRSLEGGFTRHSFAQLLGADPGRTASRGTIVDDVAHHVAAKNPVAISTHAPTSIDGATQARMDALQIYANHYYIPVEVTGSGDDTLVRLFNPWGKEHPTEPVSVTDLRRIFDGLDTPDEFVRYGSRD